MFVSKTKESLKTIGTNKTHENHNELPKVNIIYVRSEERGGREKQAIKHKTLSDLW